MEKDKNGLSFGLQASTRGKNMFLLGFFGKKWDKNLQISYISRLLTTVYMASRLSTRSMYK